MAKRRRKRPSGAVTLIAIACAAALLFVAVRWTRNAPPRRIVGGTAQVVPGAQSGVSGTEIQDDERRELQRVLNEGAKK